MWSMRFAIKLLNISIHLLHLWLNWWVDIKVLIHIVVNVIGISPCDFVLFLNSTFLIKRSNSWKLFKVLLRIFVSLFWYSTVNWTVELSLFIRPIYKIYIFYFYFYFLLQRRISVQSLIEMNMMRVVIF